MNAAGNLLVVACTQSIIDIADNHSNKAGNNKTILMINSAVIALLLTLLALLMDNIIISEPGAKNWRASRPSMPTPTFDADVGIL